jgi:hypothetical protein
LTLSFRRLDERGIGRLRHRREHDGDCENDRDPRGDSAGSSLWARHLFLLVSPVRIRTGRIDYFVDSAALRL